MQWIYSIIKLKERALVFLRWNNHTDGFLTGLDNIGLVQDPGGMLEM